VNLLENDYFVWQCLVPLVVALPFLIRALIKDLRKVRSGRGQRNDSGDGWDALMEFDMLDDDDP
jgi:hypothetical protein